MRNSSALARQVQEITDRAYKENRELTPSEAGKAEALIERAREARQLEQKLAEIDGVEPYQHGDAPGFGEGPGDVFVKSEGYRKIADPATRGGNWSTGGVEVPLSAKGTLTSNPGTGLTPAQYVPGVVETLFQRLYVADLLATQSTNSSQVRYVRESTATNAAAGVAEGGVKPESTLVFTEETVPVRKVATLLPITDELLSDAESISTYLNSRLSLFVKVEEERQLLRGTGTAPEIRGIIGASGVNTISVSGTAGTAIVENLFNVMNNTRGSSQLDPDGLVLHPNEWAKLRTSRDSQGQFFGGGPWGPSYGGPSAAAGASQFSSDRIWGVPTVVTTAVGAGTALVGSFGQAARLFRRSGVVVEASSSHGTYFASDITTLRAESRQGLAILRPQAFTTITWT